MCVFSESSVFTFCVSCTVYINMYIVCVCVCTHLHAYKFTYITYVHIRNLDMDTEMQVFIFLRLKKKNSPFPGERGLANNAVHFYCGGVCVVVHEVVVEEITFYENPFQICNVMKWIYIHISIYMYSCMSLQI